MQRVNIRMLPGEDAAAKDAGGCTVVVDTLRATSTIAAALAAGASEVITVDDEDRAREIARDTGALLAGEREGMAPSGFDAGNSPAELAGAIQPGQRVVLFTTNGTKALCGVPDDGAALAGAFVNARAVGEALASFADMEIICAGNASGTRFSLEDFVTAAVIARYAAGGYRDWHAAAANDGAMLAAELFASLDEAAMLRRAADLIAGSDHARRTRGLGLEADIAWATQPNNLRVVPYVAERTAGMAVLRPRRSD